MYLLETEWKRLGWKIEKLILEKIGHVLRMSDNRHTKNIHSRVVEVASNTVKKEEDIVIPDKLLREAGMT